jgi:hypothetical protein
LSIRSKIALLVAAIAALALIAAGCGDDDDSSASETTTESSETVSTDTGAATLRANLTHLLTEHVDLAGIAVVQAAEGGLDSPQFEAAAGALDDNSVDLSDAIGSVYGEAAGKQFLELWRAHIGMFVDYAEGALTGNQKQQEQALADLDGYREDFGAFLESANPNLTKEAVAEALDPHVQSLLTTIDSAVAGKPEVFENLRTAASHDVDLANVLAGAIAAQFPEKFGG